MRFVRLARERGGIGRSREWQGRRSRGWRGIGALLTAAALSGAAGCAEAVANSAGIFVQVSPATVNAGFQTQVTASCGESASSATVSSVAFGSETIQPNAAGVLATTVTVTPETAPGTYGVRLMCPTGSQATTTLTVIGGGSPSASVPGPGTGGGFLANNDDPAAQASEPADRTPLVWLGAGVGFLLAAAAVAVRTQKRATVRSQAHPSRHDHGNAEPR